MPKEIPGGDKLDNASEGDRKSVTSPKVAGEAVSEETQAARYEHKFTSFSSQSDLQLDPDDPLTQVMARLNTRKDGADGAAVSEFALEDKSEGRLITARGERSTHQPRASFLQGLKEIYDRATSPEEASEQQSQFSISYMLRKAQEFFEGFQQPQNSDQSKEASTPDAAQAIVTHVRLGSKDGLHELIDAKVVESVYAAQLTSPFPGDPSLANSSIPPGAYKTGVGETLASIAERHLGAKSSKHDVQAYASEIAKVNGLNPRKPAPDRTALVLPGHKEDGGLVFDGAASILTKYSTGAVVVESKTATLKSDGDFGSRSVKIMPMENGAVKELYAGPGSTDRYFAIRSHDGSRQYFDKEGGIKYSASPDAAVVLKHAELQALAAKNIVDPLDRVKFKADMVRFEDRAQRLHLPPAEIVGTYVQIARLLENVPAPISHADRVCIAEEVLSQSAEPRSIDQGIFSTCQEASIGSMIYTTDPAKAAKVVADVAMNGVAFSLDHKYSVKFDGLLAQNLIYRDGSFADGKRSFATQLFDVAAVNLAYVKDGSGKQFVSGPGDAKRRVNGELLYDKAGNVIDNDTGLDDDGAVSAYQMITGHHKGGVWSAIRDKSYPEIVASLRVAGSVLIDHEQFVNGQGKLVDRVKDERDLANLLHALKDAGQLPVCLGVHSKLEPFFSDSKGGSAGGSAGAHQVTITDYRAGPPAMVSLDNQWGSIMDHRSLNVPLHELYLAMRPPKKIIGEFKAEVESNRYRGKIETSKEFEYLRLRRLSGEIDDSTLGWDMAKLKKEADVRWGGKTDSLDYKHAMERLNAIRKHWKKDSERAYGEGSLNDWERLMRFGRPSINDPEK